MFLITCSTLALTRFQGGLFAIVGEEGAVCFYVAPYLMSQPARHSCIVLPADLRRLYSFMDFSSSF